MQGNYQQPVSNGHCARLISGHLKANIYDSFRPKRNGVPKCNISWACKFTIRKFPFSVSGNDLFCYHHFVLCEIYLEMNNLVHSEIRSKCWILLYFPEPYMKHFESHFALGNTLYLWDNFYLLYIFSNMLDFFSVEMYWKSRISDLFCAVRQEDGNEEFQSALKWLPKGWLAGNHFHSGLNWSSPAMICLECTVAWCSSYRLGVLCW